VSFIFFFQFFSLRFAAVERSDGDAHNDAWHDAAVGSIDVWAQFF
jgi:hypothetical protein